MADRSWMLLENRLCSEFLDGVKSFIAAAEADMLHQNKTAMCCPCIDCRNDKRFSKSMYLHAHLVMRGFMRNYFCWNKHGEDGINEGELDRESQACNTDHIRSSGNQGDPRSDVNILGFGEDYADMADNVEDMVHDGERDDFTDGEFAKFQRLVQDSKTPLYHGSEEKVGNFTRLSSVLKLFKLKARYCWSDKSFTELLVLLRKMLPADNKLPGDTYEAKQVICPLGLEVERIHACKNDCCLFRGDYADLENCPVCGTSRYKRQKDGGDGEGANRRRGAPRKVVWYLPIIPRLKRLFTNEKEAKLLRWHKEGRKNDGMLRHPADGSQWRNIDMQFEWFSADVRNLRFALSTDGMNPFGDRSTSHSTWPVVMSIYNLPGWLCAFPDETVLHTAEVDRRFHAVVMVDWVDDEYCDQPLPIPNDEIPTLRDALWQRILWDRLHIICRKSELPPPPQRQISRVPSPPSQNKKEKQKEEEKEEKKKENEKEREKGQKEKEKEKDKEKEKKEQGKEKEKEEKEKGKGKEKEKGKTRKDSKKSKKSKSNEVAPVWTSANPNFKMGEPILPQDELRALGGQDESLIKQSKMDKLPVGFLDPSAMSTSQLNASGSDVFDYLVKALSHFIATKKHYVMFAYNTISKEGSSHWVLVVIVLPLKQVWYLDSLRHVKRDYTNLGKVIDQAFAKVQFHHKMKKQQLTHVTDFECHQQRANDACGFYCCHHMSSIMQQSDKKKPEEIKFTSAPLTSGDLNIVTQEVAICLTVDTLPTRGDFHCPVN
ncbi:hypothetical protein ACP70R_009568 [Stipagrostis hirtigluma subsp. patula]